MNDVWEIERETVFNMDGNGVAEVYRLYNIAVENDNGMFFESYEAADVYRAKILVNNEEESCIP